MTPGGVTSPPPASVFMLFAHRAVMLCVAGSLLLPACRRGGAPVAGPMAVAAVAGAKPADALIRITGFSGTELRALEKARPDPAGWQALVRVSVSDNDLAPVAGRYRIAGGALEFQPQFPFDGGRSYTVRVDPSRPPVARSEPITEVRIQFERAQRAAASTFVSGIDPSGEVWPENMLRFYIHFSAPMSRGSGVKYVHLLDDDGAEVPDAMLAAYADLWNEDATRLTVFFDPGRVKRGVGPNVKMGRAMVVGRRYAITVDPVWPDATGQELTMPFQRTFTAGPPAYRALSPSDWRIEPPPSGTRLPLAITFPTPLDRALLDRAIGIKSADGLDVPGKVTIEAAETRWTFTPDAPWVRGALALVVLTLLEDPAGNRIGRAFEVLPSEPSAQEPADPQILRIPIQIK